MDENKEAPKAAEVSADQGDVEKNKGMAIIAYFLFFVPLLTDAKNSPFAKYHVKQSLLLVLLALAGAVVGIIPLIGWILAAIVPFVVLVLWIMGLLNAINGKMAPVPLIGKFAEEWFKF